MTRRLGAAAAALTLAALVTGCEVGRFIAGAPSSRERSTPQGLVARRCSGCHEAPDPAQMSAEEWARALKRMQRRVHLPESEWDSLAAMGRRE